MIRHTSSHNLILEKSLHNLSRARQPVQGTSKLELLWMDIADYLTGLDIAVPWFQLGPFQSEFSSININSKGILSVAEGICGELGQPQALPNLLHHKVSSWHCKGKGRLHPIHF